MDTLLSAVRPHSQARIGLGTRELLSKEQRILSQAAGYKPATLGKLRRISRALPYPPQEPVNKVPLPVRRPPGYPRETAGR